MSKLNSSLPVEKEKVTLQAILLAIKDLTPQERRLLEKELVMMRLGKEFSSIKEKLAQRRMKKGEAAKNA